MSDAFLETVGGAGLAIRRQGNQVKPDAGWSTGELHWLAQQISAGASIQRHGRDCVEARALLIIAGGHEPRVTLDKVQDRA